MPNQRKRYGTKFAKHGDSFDIYLYGLIGYDIDANSFMNKLSEIPIGTKDVNLFLHSDGGLVTEGYAIMTNLMRQREKFNITAHIDGSAFSMMSAIAVTADRTIASPTSEMMIHDPWFFLDVFGGYNKRELEVLIEELESMQDSLDKDSDILSGVYAQKMGITKEAVKEKFLNDGLDHYLSPDDMLSLGLIDEVKEFPTPDVETGFEAPDFENNDFMSKVASKKVAYRGAGERSINRFALNLKNSDSNNTEDEYSNLHKQKANKMNELQAIARQLDLNENASQDAIQREVTNLQNRVKDLEKKVEKQDGLIDDFETSVETKEARIKELETDLRKSQTSTIVQEVVEEVEGAKDNEGQEVNKNVLDDMNELALDYLEAKSKGDEKAQKRAKQHMTLIAKDNLVPVGKEKGLETDGEGDRKDAGAVDVETLQKAKEKGEAKREARKKRVTA